MRPDLCCQWDYFKAISDQGHFIFEINVGKSRIRRGPTQNDVIFNRFWVDPEIHHSISESLYVGSDSFWHWFKNKMARSELPLNHVIYLSNWLVLLLWPSHAETASNWFSFGFLSFFFFLSFLSFLSSLSFFFFFFLSLLVLPSSWSSFWFGVISIDSTRWIFSSFQVTLLRSEGELRPSRPVSERIVS